MMCAIVGRLAALSALQASGRAFYSIPSTSHCESFTDTSSLG